MVLFTGLYKFCCYIRTEYFSSKLLKILIPGVSVGKSGKNLLSSHLKARLSDQNQFYMASDQYSKCVHISLYCAIKGEKSIQGLRI